MIKIARGDEAIAEADALKARSPLLPSLNGSLGYTSMAYQPTAIYSPPTGTVYIPQQDRDFYAYSVAIQQTLLDFRGNSSRYGASKMILETKKLDTRRVGNLVALEFTVTYLDILEAEKVVAVAEAEVGRLEAHLRDAKALYAGGVITKNDLLQAEVRLSDSRAEAAHRPKPEIDSSLASQQPSPVAAAGGNPGSGGGAARSGRF